MLTATVRWSAVERGASLLPAVACRVMVPAAGLAPLPSRTIVVMTTSEAQFAAGVKLAAASAALTCAAVPVTVQMPETAS